ncbi:hypothetical protein ACFVV7_27170 [Streptomyces globisporus]|uniref:hypothetical protein n=1 Tax=Streptomyces globisporus TaxID=1908 RepID=UPI0036DABE1C
MTTIDVIDDTGANDQLRVQVADILARVAPLVEPTTGLALPERVTFRIVPPRTWQAEQGAEVLRRMRRYRMLSPLRERPLIGLKSLVSMGLFKWMAPKVGEVLVMGATQPIGDAYESQTLFVAEALQHNGVLSDPMYLTQLTVHELVHQTQNFITRHRGTWENDAPATHARELNVDVLEEGHAHWADLIMTRSEFGTSCDVFSAPKSDRYKTVSKHPLLPNAKSRSQPYEVGRTLVASTFDTVGPRIFNRVWTDARLLPTDEEVAEAAESLTADPPIQPGLWATRLQHTAAPSGDPSPSA